MKYCFIIFLSFSIAVLTQHDNKVGSNDSDTVTKLTKKHFIHKGSDGIIWTSTKG